MTQDKLVKAVINGIECYVDEYTEKKLKEKTIPLVPVNETRKFVPSQDGYTARQDKMQELVRKEILEKNKLQDKAVIDALAKFGYGILTWHPYPQEKPTENGIYIVTVFPKDKKFVSCSHYHDLFGWDHFADDMVLAWAELPKPYEG